MRSSSEVPPDWAALPYDLVRYIAGKTHSTPDLIHMTKDFIRMAAVCRSWQDSLKDQMHKIPVCLMLAETENEKDGNSWRCFCTASEDKVIIERDLPEIKGRRCWGTPYGWLITFGLDLEVKLLNPLSGASFSLPSQCTFITEERYPPDGSPRCLRKRFIRSFALSSSPTSPDCIVMAIYSFTSLLAFARPGDQAWTPFDISTARVLDDVIYFNGSFFAVCYNGDLFICQDLEGPSPKAVEFAKSPTEDEESRKYIVDLDGYLCMIARKQHYYKHVADDERGKGLEFDQLKSERRPLTYEFEIFKLDMCTREWEKIFSLGDRSVFLGNCCTFSIFAANYSNCTSNCIYFTDDESYYYERAYDPGNPAGGIDTGFYNCDNQELVRLTASIDGMQGFRSKFSPPLWILPSFY